MGLSVVMGLSLASEADARRGGSFGSRGARTYQAPPPTKTSPTQTAPVQRSMTERQPGAPATAP
ncbi:MAG: preprotein translocase subunit Tim44, partial [Phenylobacterium sp.]|nr:preprotein translocase subunit Tim44 [Phenylobacterium sp.]